MAPDPRMQAAITDLHAYALALDAERERSHDQSLRAEIAEELSALRAATIALCRHVDPAGELL